MKKLMVLFLFCTIETKLCSTPVGLVNCGNTCFQNAFIQMAYQIDPLIDVLSKRRDLYTQNTVGYTFQHLVWDLINAQKTSKSVIGCGSLDNPTNLKKLTEGVYSCMGQGVSERGDIYIGFEKFLPELQKTFYNQLTSILTVFVERTTNISGSESYIASRSRIPFFTLAASADFENNIRNLFDEGLTTLRDPQTGIYVTSDIFIRLLSVPKFIVFKHEFTVGTHHSVRDYFPDTLNLTKYIKENSQALYQLRAIGVFTGGHYFAVVRDRDEKLYVCNDSNIQQVNTWQEGIGSYHPVIFLYILKTTTNAVDALIDKLIKLQQSLENLKLMLTRQTF